MPKTRLTIGYKLDEAGEAREYTTVVEAWRDLQNATRELQLDLIGKVLCLEPWIISRRNAKEGITHGPILRSVVPDLDLGGFGVRAEVTVEFPDVDDGAVAQTIMSPGLWGVHLPDEEYLQEIFEEEREVLTRMLAAMGATPTTKENR